MEYSISYLFVLVAAAIYYVLGAVWYGIFTKVWMKAMEKTEDDIEEMKKRHPEPIWSVRSPL